MKPFNLEEALSGKAVMLLCGSTTVDNSQPTAGFGLFVFGDGSYS